MDGYLLNQIRRFIQNQAVNFVSREGISLAVRLVSLNWVYYNKIVNLWQWPQVRRNSKWLNLSN